MRGIAAIAVAGVALVTAAPGAWAQSSPSSDQIINALKPTAGTLHTGTRGIRPVAPAATAPAEDTAAAAPVGAIAKPTPKAAPKLAVAAEPAAPHVNLTVQFRTGSAELTPQAMATLDQLGQALSSQELAAYRFRIEGHTDTVGSPALNKSLSEQRAAAVADYLEKKFSVSGTRLEPVGLGQDDLLVKTPPQTPEPRNRRVQVINLGA